MSSILQNGAPGSPFEFPARADSMASFRMFKDNLAHKNVYFCLKLPSSADISMWKNAFSYAIRKHDIFRSNDGVVDKIQGLSDDDNVSVRSGDDRVSFPMTSPVIGPSPILSHQIHSPKNRTAHNSGEFRGSVLENSNHQNNNLQSRFVVDFLEYSHEDVQSLVNDYGSLKAAIEKDACFSFESHRFQVPRVRWYQCNNIPLYSTNTNFSLDNDNENPRKIVFADDAFFNHPVSVNNSTFSAQNSSNVSGSIVPMTIDGYIIMFAADSRVLDNWSASIILDDVRSFLNTTPGSLPSSVSDSTSSFNNWYFKTKQSLPRAIRKAVASHWSTQLAGGLPDLPLPYDVRARTPVLGLSCRPLKNVCDDGVAQCKVQSFCFSPGLSLAISSLARRFEISVKSVLVSALGTLLSRYCAVDDVLLGMYSDARLSPEDNSVVGPLENILPIRMNLKGGPSFEELLITTSKLVEQADSFSHYPPEAVSANLFSNITNNNNRIPNELDASSVLFASSNNINMNNNILRASSNGRTSPLDQHAAASISRGSGNLLQSLQFFQNKQEIEYKVSIREVKGMRLFENNSLSLLLLADLGQKLKIQSDYNNSNLLINQIDKDHTDYINNPSNNTNDGYIPSTDNICNSVEPLLLNSCTSTHELELRFALHKDQFFMSYLYNAEKFSTRFIESLHTHMENLMTSATSNPNLPLRRLKILSENEKTLVVHEWNRTSVALSYFPKSIGQLGNFDVHLPPSFVKSNNDRSSNGNKDNICTMNNVNHPIKLSLLPADSLDLSNPGNDSNSNQLTNSKSDENPDVLAAVAAVNDLMADIQISGSNSLNSSSNSLSCDNSKIKTALNHRSHSRSLSTAALLPTAPATTTAPNSTAALFIDLNLITKLHQQSLSPSAKTTFVADSIPALIYSQALSTPRAVAINVHERGAQMTYKSLWILSVKISKLISRASAESNAQILPMCLSMQFLMALMKRNQQSVLKELPSLNHLINGGNNSFINGKSSTTASAGYSTSNQFSSTSSNLQDNSNNIISPLQSIMEQSNINRNFTHKKQITSTLLSSSIIPSHMTASTSLIPTSQNISGVGAQSYFPSISDDINPDNVKLFTEPWALFKLANLITHADHIKISTSMPNSLNKNSQNNLTGHEPPNHVNKYSSHPSSQPPASFPSVGKVAIMLDRGAGAIAALIATMISGGVCMPIDTKLPKKRVRHMLALSSASVIVTTSSIWREKYSWLNVGRYDVSILGLPLTAVQSARIGLVDPCFDSNPPSEEADDFDDDAQDAILRKRAFCVVLIDLICDPITGESISNPPISLNSSKEPASALQQLGSLKLNLSSRSDARLHNHHQQQQHLSSMPDWDDLPGRSLLPQDNAYLFFTSGSTGVPKGVQVAHGNLIAYVTTFIGCFGMSSSDSVAHQSGMSFDACLAETWPCLCAGATLNVLVDNDIKLVPSTFCQWWADSGTTIAFATTQLCENILAEPSYPPQMKVRILFTGGDVIHRGPPVFAKFALCNVYGPTETTVNVTGTRLACDWMAESVGTNSLIPSIGKPWANAQCYIFDPHMEPCPVGVFGELYIGGPQVALGYLNRSDLTADRFVANPFAGQETPCGSSRVFELATPAPMNSADMTSLVNHVRTAFADARSSSQVTKHGALIYKTGDLVRWLPTGDIEFMGRADTQIKLRGFRIEPSEIETSLISNECVREACVVVRTLGNSPDKRLVGYWVPSDAALEAASRNFGKPQLIAAGSVKNPDTEVEATLHLKSHLSSRLPEYMVPSQLVRLARLPINPSGKVDKTALPEPNWSSGNDGSGDQENSSSLIDCASPLEEILLSAFAKVLERRGDEGATSVFLSSSFFEMGGHSLLAGKLIQMIKELLKINNLSVSVLFSNPSVRALALAISDSVSPKDLTSDKALRLVDEIGIVSSLRNKLQSLRTHMTISSPVPTPTSTITTMKAVLPSISLNISGPAQSRADSHLYTSPHMASINQRSLWFLSSTSPEASRAYNVAFPARFHLPKKLRHIVPLLLEAICVYSLGCRHDSLRTKLRLMSTKEVMSLILENDKNNRNSWNESGVDANAGVTSDIDKQSIVSQEREASKLVGRKSIAIAENLMPSFSENSSWMSSSSSSISDDSDTEQGSDEKGTSNAHNDNSDQQVVAIVDPVPQIEFEYLPVSPISSIEELGEWTSSQMYSPFNLEEGPTSRVKVFMLPESISTKNAYNSSASSTSAANNYLSGVEVDEWFIHWSLHHAFCDLWSMNVLLDDLDEAFACTLPKLFAAAGIYHPTLDSLVATPHVSSLPTDTFQSSTIAGPMGRTALFSSSLNNNNSNNNNNPISSVNTNVASTVRKGLGRRGRGRVLDVASSSSDEMELINEDEQNEHHASIFKSTTTPTAAVVAIPTSLTPPPHFAKLSTQPARSPATNLLAIFEDLKTFAEMSPADIAEHIYYSAPAASYRVWTRNQHRTVEPSTLRNAYNIHTDNYNASTAIDDAKDANMMSAERELHDSQYWLQNLSTLPEPLKLPADRIRPDAKSFEGDAVDFFIPKELANQVTQFARAEGTTPYILLLSVFATWLHRHAGSLMASGIALGEVGGLSTEIMIGTPLACRDSSSSEALLGYLVNAMPLRIKVGDDLTSEDVVARSSQALRCALDHQHLPFASLVEKVRAPRDSKRSPLFDVSFVLQTSSGRYPFLPPFFMGAPANTEQTLPKSHVTFASVNYPQRHAQFDLTLMASEVGKDAVNGYAAQLYYSTSLFNKDTIQNMANRFVTLLSSAIRRPTTQISKLAMLTDSEKYHLINDLNRTFLRMPNLSGGRSQNLLSENLISLVLRQIFLSPDTDAVVHFISCVKTPERFTYRQLLKASIKVAGAIAIHGLAHSILTGGNPEVAPKTAILSDRGFMHYSCLLASQLAGGSYLPIDPKMPEERVMRMIGLSDSNVFIVSRELLMNNPAVSWLKGMIPSFQSSLSPNYLPVVLPFSYPHDTDGHTINKAVIIIFMEDIFEMEFDSVSNMIKPSIFSSITTSFGGHDIDEVSSVIEVNKDGGDNKGDVKSSRSNSSPPYSPFRAGPSSPRNLAHLNGSLQTDTWNEEEALDQFSTRIANIIPFSEADIDLLIAENNVYLLSGGVGLITSSSFHDSFACRGVQTLLPEDHIVALFTSGSSGVPKGTFLSNRNGLSFFANSMALMGYKEGEKVTHTAGCAFDASFFEIWSAFVSGSTLFPVLNEENRMSAQGVVEFWAKVGITISFLTTQLADAVLALKSYPSDLKLRVLSCGGDKLQRNVPSHGKFRLLNIYGPTETTVFVTAAAFENTDSSENSRIHIGSPTFNTQTYVLDGHLQPCPIGVYGEMFIAGDQVATGYIGRTDLTSERFMQNPWCGINTGLTESQNTKNIKPHYVVSSLDEQITEESRHRIQYHASGAVLRSLEYHKSNPHSASIIHHGKMLYRTGDLVRWLADGSIDILGRADSQVKIRGFRIELNDIQSAIMKYYGILDAIVICENLGEGADIDKVLVAFYTADVEAHPPIESLTKPSLSDLQGELSSFLHSKVPPYMIPSYFVRISKFPLNPSGKIDKKALPTIKTIIESCSSTVSNGSAAAVAVIPPSDAVETWLRQLFAQVLHKPEEIISVTSSFFDMGGHSLSVAQLVGTIRSTFTISMPFSLVFDKPSIRALSASINMQTAGRASLILLKSKGIDNSEEDDDDDDRDDNESIRHGSETGSNKINRGNAANDHGSILPKGFSKLRLKKLVERGAPGTSLIDENNLSPVIAPVANFELAGGGGGTNLQNRLGFMTDAYEWSSNLDLSSLRAILENRSWEYLLTKGENLTAILESGVYGKYTSFILAAETKLVAAKRSASVRLIPQLGARDIKKASRQVAKDKLSASISATEDLEMLLQGRSAVSPKVVLAPLTTAQKAKYFFFKCFHGQKQSRCDLTTAHAIQINGYASVRTFKNASSILLARHAALRTSFLEVKGEPLQVIHPMATTSALDLIPLILDETSIKSLGFAGASQEAIDHYLATLAPWDLTGSSKTLFKMVIVFHPSDPRASVLQEELFGRVIPSSSLKNSLANVLDATALSHLHNSEVARDQFALIHAKAAIQAASLNIPCAVCFTAASIVLDEFSVQNLLKDFQNIMKNASIIPSLSYAPLFEIEQTAGMDFSIFHPTMADVAVYEKLWLSSDASDAELSFWSSYLAGLTFYSTNLPPRVIPPSAHEAFEENPFVSLRSSLSSNALIDLHRFIGLHLPFQTMILGCFHLILHVFTRQSTVLIGLPVHNRHHNSFNKSVGSISNLIAVRSDLETNENITLRDFLDCVKRSAFDAFEHQDIPFPILVDRLIDNVRPQNMQNMLLQIAFTYSRLGDSFDLSNPSVKTNTSAGISLPLSRPPIAANMDLSLRVTDFSNSAVNSLHQSSGKDGFSLRFDMSYNPSRISPSLALSILQSLDCLISSIERHFMSNIFTIPILNVPQLTSLQAINKINLTSPSIEDQPIQLIEDVLCKKEDQSAKSIALDDLTLYRETPVGQGSNISSYSTLPAHHLFSLRAQSLPNRIVLEDDSFAFTAEQVEHASNRLAQMMKKRSKISSGLDHIVLIYTKRSVEAIIAMLASWKSGAGYWLVDPDTPIETIKSLSETLKPRALLFSRQSRNKMELISEIIDSIGNRNLHEEGEFIVGGNSNKERASHKPGVYMVEQFYDDSAVSSLKIPHTAAKLKSILLPESLLPSRETPTSSTSVHSLACVSFTLGTSGNAKIAYITHGSFTNMIWAYRRELGVTCADTHVQVASVSFDVFNIEVWPALTAAAKVVIAPPSAKRDSAELLNFIESKKITLACISTHIAENLFMSPRLLAQSTSLRHLTVGGDNLKKLPPPGCSFIVKNAYGPAECCVLSTWFTIEDQVIYPIPIGNPIMNCSAFIVNDFHFPVPPGAVGELILAGANVSRGYVGDSVRTQNSFVTIKEGPLTGLRVFKTGDLVRMDENKDINFVSRKYAGFNSPVTAVVEGQVIKLIDVEIALAAQPEVYSSAIVAIPDFDLEPLNKNNNNNNKDFSSYLSSSSRDLKLVAFVVPHTLDPVTNLMVPVTVTPPGSKRLVSSPENYWVDSNLANSISSRMRKSVNSPNLIPTVIIFVTEIPQNLYCKIDRRKLRNLIIDEQLKRHSIGENFFLSLSHALKSHTIVKSSTLLANSSSSANNSKKKSGKIPTVSRILPSSQLEATLLSEFSLVLNCDIQSVHDDFFLMGGNSFNVLALLSEINSYFDIDLLPSDIFSHPSVFLLAQYIEKLPNYNSSVLLKNQKNSRDSTTFDVLNPDKKSHQENDEEIEIKPIPGDESSNEPLGYTKDNLYLEAKLEWKSCVKRAPPQIKSLTPTTRARLVIRENSAPLIDSYPTNQNIPTNVVKESFSEIFDSSRKAPKCVLFTGVTGFLGAFMVAIAAHRWPETRILCLIRSKDQATAKIRLIDALDKYQLTLPPGCIIDGDAEGTLGRIIPVLGDLKQPLLGLQRWVIEEITLNCEAVLHAGAEVNSVLPYRSLKSANVLGTVEAIRLCMIPAERSALELPEDVKQMIAEVESATSESIWREKQAALDIKLRSEFPIEVIPFHFVSTLSVFAPGMKRSLDLEEWPPAVRASKNEEGRNCIFEDDPLDIAGHLKGYGASKWVSERICQRLAHSLVKLCMRRFHHPATAAANVNNSSSAHIHSLHNSMPVGIPIPVRVYRPGRIFAHSSTGAANASDFLSLIVRGSCAMGISPTLDWPQELTPVDQVTGALLVGLESQLKRPFHNVDDVLSRYFVNEQGNSDSEFLRLISSKSKNVILNDEFASPGAVSSFVPSHTDSKGVRRVTRAECFNIQTPLNVSLMTLMKWVSDGPHGSNSLGLIELPYCAWRDHLLLDCVTNPDHVLFGLQPVFHPTEEVMGGRKDFPYFYVKNTSSRLLEPLKWPFEVVPKDLIGKWVYYMVEMRQIPPPLTFRENEMDLNNFDDFKCSNDNFILRFNSQPDIALMDKENEEEQILHHRRFSGGRVNSQHSIGARKSVLSSSSAIDSSLTIRDSVAIQPSILALEMPESSVDGIDVENIFSKN